MKNILKSTAVVSTILIACALLFASCAGNSPEKNSTMRPASEGLDYSVNSNGATCTITGLGTCTDTDIFIGKYIDEYLVTAIGDSAFEDCSDLISVTIGNRLTSIGYGAFMGCSSLRSIEIPDSVTSIGESAFSGCSNLTSIEIPDSVTSIGESTFSGCSNLTSIEIPDSVTSIGYRAFEGCSSLTSIEIPNSVTSIGESAFSGCSNLTSIEIPDSVTSIDESVFGYCENIESIIVDENNAEYYSKNNCLIEKETQRLIFGYKNSIIPKEVTSIGYGAFRGCSNLTSIEIPDSVTSIGDRAFEGCSNLTSIEIPDSVTSIGEGVFGYCENIESIIVDENNAEYYSKNNCLIEKERQMLIFGHKNSIIPKEVTSIGNGAFYGCSNLTSIEIPDSVTSIGHYAFSGCSSLTSIEIPDSVTSIGMCAVGNCSSLTKITYTGTMAEWDEIEEQQFWDSDTGSYTIYCTDGEIEK